MTEIIVRMENNGQLTPVRQLVRCKDCKNRNNPIDCQMESEGMHTSDDWFCADGEPKEGDPE